MSSCPILPPSSVVSPKTAALTKLPGMNVKFVTNSSFLLSFLSPFVVPPKKAPSEEKRVKIWKACRERAAKAVTNCGNRGKRAGTIAKVRKTIGKTSKPRSKAQLSNRTAGTAAIVLVSEGSELERLPTRARSISSEFPTSISIRFVSILPLCVPWLEGKRSTSCAYRKLGLPNHLWPICVSEVDGRWWPFRLTWWTEVAAGAWPC